MGAKGGVGEVALMSRPAIDPIVGDRHQLIAEGLTFGVNPWPVLLPLGIGLVAVLNGAVWHRRIPATAAAVATFAASVLGALGSMRARRTGQRGATALAPVKHDRLRRLWPCLNCKRREGNFSARRVDESTELGERA
eukprot:3091409-Prymnesium_polylepis.1